MVFDGKLRVFEDGTVYRIKNGVETIAAQYNLGLPCKSNGSSYKAVSCTLKNGKQVHPYVHRLVAEAFIPNQDNKAEVNHIDGNRANNNVKNLEWVTRSENTIHAYSNGLIDRLKNGVPCKKCGKLTNSASGYCPRHYYLLESNEKKQLKSNNQIDKYKNINADLFSGRQRLAVIEAKKGKSQAEIGRTLGISRERVRQLLNGAETVKDFYEKEIWALPKVKDGTHPMKRLLLGYEVNGANLATAIGCSEPTARKKLNDPSRLTLGDLEQIHHKFGIPCEDIRERVI